MILALEDSQLVATRYAGQLLLEKKICTIKQTLAEINRITTGDVFRVAKDVFRPGKLNLALIGPYKNEDAFQKIIK
jgi:predicted Zn-dependent peptidase